MRKTICNAQRPVETLAACGLHRCELRGADLGRSLARRRGRGTPRQSADRRVQPRAPLSRRLNLALDAIEDLLSLRHVDDPDRIEAERFAAIEPEHPVVAELCLLLEGLRTARAAEECEQ